MPDTEFTGLAGRRVVLRRFRPADLDSFVAYRTLPAVARYQGWDAPYPREAGERLIGRLSGQHPDTPGEWFQFAVVLAAGGELIGDCGALVPDSEPRQAEIGFTIAPAYQGRGYGAEAVRLLLEYLFASRAKHRVSATCDARNTASARLLARVGMRCEGHLRESARFKGAWADELLYALLDHEWRARSLH